MTEISRNDIAVATALPKVFECKLPLRFAAGCGTQSGDALTQPAKIRCCPATSKEKLYRSLSVRSENKTCSAIVAMTMRQNKSFEEDAK